MFFFSLRRTLVARLLGGIQVSPTRFWSGSFE
jgi:hypothetical protein